MIRFGVFSLVLVIFAGCAQLKLPVFRSAPEPPVEDVAKVRPVARPSDGTALPPADARTVEDFDTTSAEERSQASAGVNVGKAVELGTTIASLGSASEPGFWLKTPLVDQPAMGRVDYAETGQSVAVDLIPLDAKRGAGSRISLPAMRLIGAPLTGLPELRVFRLQN